MRANWTGRRQAERRTCSIKAQAQFYDGSPSYDCIITDYSPAGARIEFPPDRDPPGAFDLFVPSRGDTKHALLRWRTPDAIGVEFIQARGTTGDQRLSELLVRVSRIEDDLRALRAGAVLAQATGPSPPAATANDVMTEHVDVTALVARITALETRTADEAADLVRRVVTLEAANGEMLRALKQTLAMLGDLRTATTPLAKAS